MSHVIRHFTGSLGNYFTPTRELIFFFNLSFISLLQFRGSMEIIFNVVDDKRKRPFSILFFFFEIEKFDFCIFRTCFVNHRLSFLMNIILCKLTIIADNKTLLNQRYNFICNFILIQIENRCVRVKMKDLVSIMIIFFVKSK